MPVPFADLQLQYQTIKSEIDGAISAVIRDNAFIRGAYVDAFEREFAGAAEAKHCVSCANGTDALYLAMAALRVRPGDEVITTAHSWISTSAMITHAGASVVFCDTDSATFTIDPKAIEAAITPRTRAILPVHIFGYPCEIDRINEIAARHGLAVIEDAAEAVGALARGRRIGTHGNPAVFAFYPNKQITTGEGGMLTTDDADVQAGLQSLTNQGRADTGQWLEHDRLGYNYRLDELSAAMGVAQLERIDQILGQRAAVAARYGELLADVPGVGLPAPDAGGDVRSWFVYVVRLDPSFDRNEVMELLGQRGVSSKPYLPTVHLQSYFRELGHGEGECPVAEEAAKRTLALPFHTRLDPRDQERVAEILADVLAAL